MTKKVLNSVRTTYNKRHNIMICGELSRKCFANNVSLKMESSWLEQENLLQKKHSNLQKKELGNGFQMLIIILCFFSIR